MADELSDARLPNLVLAGTTKAGSTSLTVYLREHPDVYVPAIKELNHFSTVLYGEAPPPLDDYLAYYADAGTQRWRMDASPFYFVGGSATAQAIAATLDRPRVLITLRDPVDRLWSSFRYKRSKGYVARTQTFGAFFDECVAHFEAGTDLLAENSNFLTLRSGRYADYLPAWTGTFGDDLRVVLVEDLSARPVETMRELFEWLDVDASVADGLDYAARNVTEQPRSVAARRVAHRVNRAVAPVLAARPALADRARKVYGLVNNSGRDGLHLSEADRERAARFYASSNAATATALAAHGVHPLPAWASAGG